MHCDGHERSQVGPVLEDLAISRHAREQVTAVRPETGPERQLLRTHDHIDRVDLHHTDVLEQPADVAAVDAPRGAGGREALGSERDPAGGRQRDRLPGGAGRLRGAAGQASGMVEPAGPTYTTIPYEPDDRGA